MKTCSSLPLILLSCLVASWLPAQLGPGEGGLLGGLSRDVRLDAVLVKLFGEDGAFSAEYTLDLQGNQEGAATIPGKVSYLGGKSRIDLDLARIQSKKFPPEAGAQLKAMGMAEMQVILRPDKKVTYVVYPGLRAYIEQPTPGGEFKTTTTDLGRETVEGRACAKSKVVFSTAKGTQLEVTVSKAADLKNLPIRLASSQGGNAFTATLKNVQLTKPAAASFDAPAGLTRYNDMQTLMQEVVLKRRAPSGGAGPK
jgi:hypothetical protein